MRAIDGALEVERSIDFGGVTLGRERLARITLRNAGRAPLRIEVPRFEQPSPVDFAVPQPDAIVLSPGQTHDLPLRFQPAALGLRASRLLLETDAARTPMGTVDLVGEGVLGRAELGTHRIDFGRVAVRDSLTLPLRLTNGETTAAEVHVAKATGDDPLDFQTDPTGAVTVGAGLYRDVLVTFAPSHLGPEGAQVEVLPCPTCAPEIVLLVGEGIAATLVADPLELHFGSVAPGQVVTREVTFTNAGSRPVTLVSATLGQATSDAITTDGLPVDGIELAPGESVTVTVTFAPTELADSTGTLRVSTREGEGRNRREGLVSVLLDGVGGGPDIDVRPSTLGFPRTGVGLVVEKNVTIYNVGNDPTNQRPLIVRDFYIDGATSPNGGEFDVHGLNLQPGDAITAGGARTLRVSYSPAVAGSATANLHILSNDGDEPVVVVPLTASASNLGPCVYEIVPDRLDFGAVPTGSTAHLSFVVRNVGTTSCAVANVHLARGTPPQFVLQPISSRLVDPGGEFLVVVDFTPANDLPVSGRVQFDVSSPTRPAGEVLLVGRGLDACLQIEPPVLDFGVVGLACTAPVRSVTVRNTCAQAVDFNQAFVGSGLSDAFSVDPSSAGAQQLVPGSEVRVDVTYDPDVEGDDSAPLYVDTSLSPAPALVGLVGRAELRPTRRDRFVEPPEEKVDFLFVVDNSGSLMEEQDAISRNFDSFIQTANARGTDFRIAVTTTGLLPYRGGWAECPGGVDGGEAGRFFPVTNATPRVLTPQTPNLKQVFATNVKVGVCHWWEEGLEASRLALSPPLIDHADAPGTPEPDDGNLGFLREEARLYVLYVSDEDDAGTVATDDYVAFLRGLKPGRPDLVSASAIVGLPSCATAPSVGTRYMAVANALGGMVADICSPDWEGLLQRIGQDAFTPNVTFPLSTAPDGRDMRVLVNGVEVARVDSNGEEQWHYDPTIGVFGAVVFSDVHAPGPNSVIEVVYPVPCPPVRTR